MTPLIALDAIVMIALLAFIAVMCFLILWNPRRSERHKKSNDAQTTVAPPQILDRLHLPAGGLPLQIPEWTPDCATAWRHFLGTEAGKVFAARLYFIHAATAVQASKAQAQGLTNMATFADCVAWIESLSRITGAQVTTEPQAEGEPATFEQNA